jgi:hypothetical protein
LEPAGNPKTHKGKEDGNMSEDNKSAYVIGDDMGGFGELTRCYAIRVDDDSLAWYGVFCSFPDPEKAANSFYSLVPPGFVLADR